MASNFPPLSKDRLVPVQPLETPAGLAFAMKYAINCPDIPAELVNKAAKMFEDGLKHAKDAEYDEIKKSK